MLGRTVKTEILNWQGGSVYSATVNSFNARDQLTQVRQYAGAEGSGTYQDTTVTYDGYGRLKTRHVPEQSTGANTVWDYNSDDTIQKITDARGAVANYGYNNRHLLTGITYTVPSGSQVPVPGEISYEYDAASNRTSMTDGTGSTTYGYDSLSRLSSESRTFTGFSGTYSLTYSYNFANALTGLSIPFRSQQIGYSYDNAGRLSGVTGSGFTATYTVWPNVYTQNVSSFASNIGYRAWGARKSMTYGNTTSEQTAYNSRLQPTTYTLNNMNYQNTNVCCPSLIYSTMTWTFDYFNDGRIKTAWDSSNSWFDRAYKYDHAGRLKEASTYRRARGLSPYPTDPSPDPYFQNITYDAFNHMSRTGLLYTGEPSDVGSWVNNRRSDLGWQYDTDGNTTVDPNFTHTFDAAGKPLHVVSFARVGDGINNPYQPSTDIAQTYDGTGAPAKRIQISRQPDPLDSEAPPVEDAQTTYYLTSAVLGGAAVVELNGPGAIDTVNIYAGGERIARDISGNISFEHTNPATGSRIISAGYSGYRGTSRTERDTFGAEIPTSNPFPSAQSYSDYKFGEQMYIEGGDPFDYSTGREIDGIPVSETEFQRRIGNGNAVGDLFRGGRYIGSINFSRLTSFSRITITFDVFQPPDELDKHPELWPSYYVGSFTEEVELSGAQRSPKPIPFRPNQHVIGLVNTMLGNQTCFDFLKTVLNKASTKGNPVLHDGDIKAIFADFLDQRQGGIMRGPIPGARYGSATGKIGSAGAGNGIIYTNKTADQDRDDARTIVEELPHLAGAKGGYPNRREFDDLDLARATRDTGYDKFFRFFTIQNPFSRFPTEKLQEQNRYSNVWSSYFHDIMRQHCPHP